ncbi:hypothetical protein H6CHR_01185 [Variovorax sp. PBL-H6]|uniref:hypothetical protein n=1 Tax=Variovorax sp. PBL-H6 TaxID=434009 RepID=UPI0013164149|nr:hypothetical protein [Variovorax sp. PBL-H6]VTU19450.1 hypothetical protein H6CHR_01185 [Variovorax sp. PBL-H6]
MQLASWSDTEPRSDYNIGTTRTMIASSRGGTSTELATGFTLSLSESTSLYGEVGKLWASGGDTRVKSQLNASAGLRVRW